MYKTSVAISLERIFKNGIDLLLDQVKKGKIDRIFLCENGFIYSNDLVCNSHYEEVKELISFLKKEGFEVGIWISSLGHGCMLPGMELTDEERTFTNLKGVNGGVAEHGFCPSDDNLIRVCCDRIKRLAALEPDMIQLDDDYRLNFRGGIELACFCDKHLEEYYTRIGERIPLENIKKLILSGGKNKYRTAYMEMCRDALLGFAKALRSAVDEINPNIRLNSCGTHENWDAAGTDMIEIAKAFAGNTRPFMRTNAGPYWHNGGTYKTLIDIIEFTRMQANWCKDEDIELFAEGDTYPRPRYNKPSSLLELFDLPLFASNEIEGDLKYMIDYFFRPEYETGYIDSHIRNAEIRNSLAEIFKGKKAVGPRVVVTLHMAENREFPEDSIDEIYSLKDEYRYLAFLPSNSIPTTFEDTGYPALVIGENAKYVTEDDLKNGAIIDVKAAEILNKRGFDTGLISAEKTAVSFEDFPRYNDYVDRVDTGEMYKISVKDDAEILGSFEPIKTPSSYIYGKFMVIAVDMTYSYENRNYLTKNFFFNYYRQADLIYGIEKLSGKKLPVVSKKYPMLYTLASKDENSMAVALSNVFEDGIYNGKFELDKEYSEVKFINCTGKLEGNTVTIDNIPPFSFAAFEVR